MPCIVREHATCATRIGEATDRRTSGAVATHPPVSRNSPVRYTAEMCQGRPNLPDGGSANLTDWQGFPLEGTIDDDSRG